MERRLVFGLATLVTLAAAAYEIREYRVEMRELVSQNSIQFAIDEYRDNDCAYNPLMPMGRCDAVLTFVRSKGYE